MRNGALTDPIDAGYKLRAETVKSDRRAWPPLWMAVMLIDDKAIAGATVS